MCAENTQIALADSKQKKIKILIIDDDPVYSAVIQSFLQGIGTFDISIATTGKAAVQLFSQDFDLIFCDINLPDIKGPKLTQYYRKDHPQKDTPIICCSTDVDNVRRECIESGMDDFLLKPILPDKLEEILNCWIVHKIIKEDTPVRI